MIDIKKYILDNKWLSLLSVMIISVVIIGVVSAPPRQNTMPRSAVSATASQKQTMLVDGNSWNSIDAMPISVVDKIQIKSSLLKIALEASIINGNPIINPTAPLQEYVAYVDKFYKEPQNIGIPVFFALKIADMATSGAPEMALRGYQQAVLQKLQQAGLLK